MSPEERARELLPILIARAASSQDEQCINLLAAAIRAAVAEERERAAKVADVYADAWRNQKRPSQAGAGKVDAGLFIAARIREEPQP